MAKNKQAAPYNGKRMENIKLLFLKKGGFFFELGIIRPKRFQK